MPEQTRPLHGGDLNAAITSALVGIQTGYMGRGPKSASTFHKNNVDRHAPLRRHDAGRAITGRQ